jgi:hypothetical protein
MPGETLQIWLRSLKVLEFFSVHAAVLIILELLNIIWTTDFE